MFEIIAKDKNTRARVGRLHNAYGGVAETPSYVIVGTRGEVRTLSPEDLTATRTQVVISNTYHLWRMLGKGLNEFEGLHKKLGTNAILMTDSGGFQVFSLGFAREHGVSKVGVAPNFGKNFVHDALLQLRTWLGIRRGRNLVRVMPWGAYFKDESYGDTHEIVLDAETSIAIQERLGADIILAFDECTSPMHGYWYTKWSMRRTHRWAKRCVDAKKRKDQMLYGIVQGGNFEDLRTESAKVIAAMPFDGFAIGGSFGEKEMHKVLEWSVPHLPDEKPRHLLGIGRIEDILEGVAQGIDTFDCVIPTREGRHGSIWTHSGRYNVAKSVCAGSGEPLEQGCACPTCTEGITQGKLHELFHAKDMRAGRYATVHNVYFFNTFMAEVRAAIKKGTFSEFRARVEATLHYGA